MDHTINNRIYSGEIQHQMALLSFISRQLQNYDRVLALWSIIDYKLIICIAIPLFSAQKTLFQCCAKVYSQNWIVGSSWKDRRPQFFSSPIRVLFLSFVPLLAAFRFMVPFSFICLLLFNSLMR